MESRWIDRVLSSTAITFTDVLGNLKIGNETTNQPKRLNTKSGRPQKRLKSLGFIIRNINILINNINMRSKYE